MDKRLKQQGNQADNRKDGGLAILTYTASNKTITASII